MIDGRCAVCTPQYNFVRVISTLEVHWQPAKCRVKVANAARCSSRTRAKLVTNDHLKFIYFSRATRICPSFVNNFPLAESADIDEVATSKSVSFFYVFHCAVHWDVAVVFQHSFYGVLSQFSSSGSQYPKTPTVSYNQGG
jgi:hypothetical protein